MRASCSVVKACRLPLPPCAAGLGRAAFDWDSAVVWCVTAGVLLPKLLDLSIVSLSLISESLRGNEPSLTQCLQHNPALIRCFGHCG